MTAWLSCAATRVVVRELRNRILRLCCKAIGCRHPPRLATEMQAAVPLWKVSSAPPRRRTKPGPQGPGFLLLRREWSKCTCRRRHSTDPPGAPGSMKISILDDYHDTLRTLAVLSASSTATTSRSGTITSRTSMSLAERLRDTEVLVLIRERTQIRAPLLERLPKLKLISQRSVYPHIDVDACTRLGVDRVVEPASRHAVLRHRGIDLGPGARRDAPDSPAGGGAQGRQMADRRRHHAARQDARHLRLRPDRQRRRRLRAGVRHERGGVGARRRRSPRRAPTAMRPRRAKKRSSPTATSSRCTCGWSTRRATSSPPPIWRG